MVRTLLGFLGIAALALLAINLLFADDLDRVEEEMERLVEVAEEGGEAAVEEILDAFADDYRGSGFFSRESIERRLRVLLVPPERVSDLRHGDFAPVAKGEEILIPIVSLRGSVEGEERQVLLAVTFGYRDDRWKIVDVTRLQFGRN